MQRENHGQGIKTGVQRFNESPPAARRKGDPQAAQRGRLFRGGAFCRCSDLVALFPETAILLHCLRRLVFELKRGVSLSAAARSAAALVYDKLTPNCHPKFRVFLTNNLYGLFTCMTLLNACI